MTKPRIVLAIPTLRPLKNGKIPKRVKKFAEGFASIMPEYEIAVIHSAFEREAHAVNMLIDEFRSDPANIWFVWWNLAVLMGPRDLRRLILTRHAVIGALFTDCERRANWQASFYPGVTPSENGTFPVAELGAGVKVFHREVFELIEGKNPNLRYIFDNSGKSVVAFCQDRIVPVQEYRRMLSPAFNLDQLCRESGIGVFSHSEVVLKRLAPDGSIHPSRIIPRPWLSKREPPPVCVEDLPTCDKDPRKIGVYIQFCEKDEAQADRLFERLCEQNISAGMQFSFGDKYPAGPNTTALGFFRMHFPPEIYKGVLLLEPDCCPTSEEWFEKLSGDWDKARAAGKLIMGSWHPINYTHPHLGHLNGNLIFDPEIAKKLTIPDVPDDEPWDTYLADVFAPVWCRTGLIKNLNRHRTATIEQITTPECGTVPPVLIHGVKDESVWNYAKEHCK